MAGSNCLRSAAHLEQHYFDRPLRSIVTDHLLLLFLHRVRANNRVPDWLTNALLSSCATGPPVGMIVSRGLLTYNLRFHRELYPKRTLRIDRKIHSVAGRSNVLNYDIYYANTLSSKLGMILTWRATALSGSSLPAQTGIRGAPRCSTATGRGLTTTCCWSTASLCWTTSGMP